VLKPGRPREWRLSLYLGPLVSTWLMRTMAWSLRRTDVGLEHPDGCLARGERIIFAFWHGQLLMMPFSYARARVTILVSQHRDGEYISRIARRLGLEVERGSATRGGARAFRQLVQRLRTDRSVAITPDGPKGPRGRVKSGVIELSRLSGMPIVPLAFGAFPRKTLASWDGFVIPYPCARAVYVWGKPLRIPPDISKAEAARYQQVLAAELDAATEQANRLAEKSR
jgi:lysophospholipid acyltransferase (LPLAT)-like uncharacterized protein